MPDDAAAPRLDHVALLVRDEEAALRLWRDLLGAAPVGRATAADPRVSLVNLRLGAVEVQLVMAPPEHPSAHGLGDADCVLHHLGLAVEDLAGERDRAAAAALVEPGAPTIQATRGRRAVFLDRSRTDGALVELLGAAAAS